MSFIEFTQQDLIVSDWEWKKQSIPGVKEFDFEGPVRIADDVLESISKDEVFTLLADIKKHINQYGRLNDTQTFFKDDLQLVITDMCFSFMKYDDRFDEDFRKEHAYILVQFSDFDYHYDWNYHKFTDVAIGFSNNVLPAAAESKLKQDIFWDPDNVWSLMDTICKKKVENNDQTIFFFKEKNWNLSNDELEPIIKFVKSLSKEDYGLVSIKESEDFIRYEGNYEKFGLVGERLISFTNENGQTSNLSKTA